MKIDRPTFFADVYTSWKKSSVDLAVDSIICISNGLPMRPPHIVAIILSGRLSGVSGHTPTSDRCAPRIAGERKESGYCALPM